MKHFIRTGFGISEEYLIWDLINNPGGLGQGNGGGPTSFHSLMLPLEKAYEAETGHGVAYTNPDSSRKFFQWLISYVDDNTILVKMENLGYEDTAQKMIGVAKKCLGIWQKLVHITGGELELTKSCFSLMTWKLNNGTEELSSIKDEPGTLNLRSGKYTGLEVDLRRNSV